MVNVRCSGFNDKIWMYVAEYAKMKGMSRCEALEQIVVEHMRVVAEAQRRFDEKVLTEAKKKMGGKEEGNV